MSKFWQFVIKDTYLDEASLKLILRGRYEYLACGFDDYDGKTYVNGYVVFLRKTSKNRVLRLLGNSTYCEVVRPNLIGFPSIAYCQKHLVHFSDGIHL